MGSGLPAFQATVLVNLYRKIANLEPVALSTVESYSNASPCVKKFSRCSKKSGKVDEGTVWAQCRVQQCLQMKEQLRLGTLSAEDLAAINSPLPPLKRHGVVFSTSIMSSADWGAFLEQRF